MKNLFLSLLVLGSLNLKAESHGQVRAANQRFQAVNDYALSEGGDLYRVQKVERLKTCSSGSSLYIVAYGGGNAQGIESVSYFELVEATSSFDSAGEEIATTKVVKEVCN